MSRKYDCSSNKYWLQYTGTYIGSASAVTHVLYSTGISAVVLYSTGIRTATLGLDIDPSMNPSMNLMS